MSIILSIDSYEKVVVPGKTAETMSVTRNVLIQGQNYPMTVWLKSPNTLKVTRTTFGDHQAIRARGETAPVNVELKLNQQLNVTKATRLYASSLMFGAGSSLYIVQVVSKAPMTGALEHFVDSFQVT